MTSKVDLEINQGSDYSVFFVIRDSATAKSTADTAQSTATAAQSAASTAQSDVDALEAAIGATDTNFAKVYTDARDGASE